MNKIFIFIVFLLITLSILAMSHFLVYKFIVRFLNLSSPLVKKILVIILLLLSLSFIFSSLIAHYSENFFSKSFYFISGVWLGILLNLLMAIILSYLVVKTLKSFGYHPSLLLIILLAFFLVFAYSGFGIWNAFNPVVKKVEVKIKNLPESWKDKKIVQLSDLHLGLVHGRSFLEEVVKKTNAVKPDLVVITGDLFDGMDGDFSSFLEPLNNIKAEKGVFFVTGNHETYFGIEKAIFILSKTKIVILDDEIIDLEGLEIIGISYPQMGEEKNIKDIILTQKNYNKDSPKILLYHSPINIGQIKENGKTSQLKTHWFFDEARAAADEIGINLQLSGHTHKGQIFPLNYISKLMYGGYEYGLYQQGDFFLYTSCGTGTWGPAMRTGNRPEIVAIKLK